MMKTNMCMTGGEKCDKCEKYDICQKRTQAELTAELKGLFDEYPDRVLIPITEGTRRGLAGVSQARADEVVRIGQRLYYKSIDTPEKLCLAVLGKFTAEGMNEEEKAAFFEALPWEECILLFVDNTHGRQCIDRVMAI